MSNCAICQEALTIYRDDGNLDENEVPDEVPDDVELRCGCHFHWQCLLDAGQVNLCPKCGSRTVSATPNGHEQVLCTIKNEGGLQESVDIRSALEDEAYLLIHPEERMPRAFLDFCREGDMEAVVDLLHAQRGELQGTASTSSAVLRFQDSRDSMKSALHYSVVEGNDEVTWLLLLLASSLDLRHFPPAVKDAANQMDLVRENQQGLEDIRNLRDENGLTAGQRAAANPENTFDTRLLTA